MRKLIGLVLVAAGGYGVYTGYQKYNSFGEELMRELTTQPRTEPILLMVLGGVAVLAGLYLILKGK